MWILAFKNHLVNKVIGYFEWPIGQLLMSLLFGDADLLPKSASHSFKIIGIQHIVAASGYNVNLILSMFSWLFSRFWPFYRLVGSSLVIAFYVVVAGASPSLLRASAQTVLALTISLVARRPTKPLWLGLIVAVVLISWQPTLLTAISFQLSFLSTLAMAALTEVMQQPGWLASVSKPIQTASSPFHRLVSKLGEGLFSDLKVGITVQAVTGPVIWWYFQEWSWLSLPANQLLGWLTAYLTMAALISLLGLVVTEAVPLLSLLWWGWVVMVNQLGQIFWQGSNWLAQFESWFWKLPALPGWGLAGWWGGVVMVGWWWRRHRLRAVETLVEKGNYLW